MRRNVREGFPGGVTVEWVLRDALEFTRFVGGVRGKAVLLERPRWVGL